MDKPLESDNLRPLPTVADAMVKTLEQLGYRVVPPGSALNDQLLARMEGFVSDLMVIDGMTRRGAALPLDYRTQTLPPIVRMANRILEALQDGEAATHPWSADHA